MVSHRTVMAIFGLSLLCAQSVLAQWVKMNASFGGNVYCLSVSGTNLVAGSYGGGVFRSTDDGVSWTPVNDGLTRKYVSALAFSGTKLFAGTPDSGVYVSTNNGKNWTTARAGLPEGSNQVTSFAVYGTGLFAGTYLGLFASTDDGANWDSAMNGLVGSVSSLVVSGTDLFAATEGLGIYQSTNFGKNWSTVNVGLPTLLYAKTIVASGSNLFTGTWGYGVFRSTDNAGSWSMPDSTISQIYVTRLAVSGSNLFAGTVGHGVLLSTNNGNSWSEVNIGLQNVFFVYSLLVSHGYLFAAADSLIYRRPLSEMVTSTRQEGQGIPEAMTLAQNYPNPFNPSTTIRYGVPSRSHVRLMVFNTLGQQVAKLVDDEVDAGYHHARFDGSEYASGVYLCLYQVGESVLTKRLMLLK